jgi:hypothetical protein
VTSFWVSLAFWVGTVAGLQDGGVTGVLRDEGNRPMPQARVLACMQKVCLVGHTGADGRFTFQIDPPVDVVIKTEEQPDATPRRGAAVLPVRLRESRVVVDVGAVVVPTLPAGRPFGPGVQDPQTVDVGDGLTLTLSRQALKPAAGQAILNVAARRLRPAAIRRYPPLADETIVAVYALHPFAATSRSPIAVRLPSRLAAGTRVKFRTIDEIDGSLSEPVAGMSTGRYLATDPAAGINRLTYLVISR